jgi:type IV fimbrial biogenesis protein FimT
MQGDVMTKKMGDSKGYSLMELMMVVVIIGVLAAMAIPNLKGWFSKNDLDRAARDVFAVLQQSRLEAIKQNKEVRVGFDDSTQTYKAWVVGGTTFLGPTSLPAHMSFDDANFTSSLGINANTTGFTSRGLALQQGSVTIVSSDAPSGHNKRVITMTVGGNAAIQTP